MLLLQEIECTILSPLRTGFLGFSRLVERVAGDWLLEDSRNLVCRRLKRIRKAGARREGILSLFDIGERVHSLLLRRLLERILEKLGLGWLFLFESFVLFVVKQRLER